MYAVTKKYIREHSGSACSFPVPTDGFGQYRATHNATVWLRRTG